MATTITPDQIIDKRRLLEVPGPIGDVTQAATAAQQSAESARDEAVAAASTAVGVQDGSMAVRINDSESLTHAALSGLYIPLLTHAVFIGDSWTYGINTSAPEKRWPTVFCALNGLVEHNYARGNAGYVHVGDGDTTFGIQANQAIADKTYDHRNVRYVIVMGGYNDRIYGENTDNVYTNSVSLLKAVKNEFVNARIVVVSLNDLCGRYVDVVSMQYEKSIEGAARDTGVMLMQNPSIQFLTAPENVSGNHPNDAGYNVLAKLISQELNGGQQRILYLLNKDIASAFTVDANLVVMQFHMWVRSYVANDLMKVKLRMRLNLKNDTTNAQIPLFSIPTPTYAQDASEVDVATAFRFENETYFSFYYNYSCVPLVANRSASADGTRDIYTIDATFFNKPSFKAGEIFYVNFDGELPLRTLAY
jgi:lysophospholipase L1-like esterase